MEKYTIAFELAPSIKDDMICLYTEIRMKEKGKLVWEGDYYISIENINHVYSDKYYQKQTIRKILNGEPSSFRLVKKPTIEDVFCYLLMDSNCDMSFRDWCEKFEYNHDSIKDKKVYDECCETRHQLVQSIGRNEMERLSDLLKDY